MEVCTARELTRQAEHWSWKQRTMVSVSEGKGAGGLKSFFIYKVRALQWITSNS